MGLGAGRKRSLSQVHWTDGGQPSPPPWEGGREDCTCLSGTMFMGSRGGGCRQGRKAGTQLCKSTPIPWLLEELSLVLRQIWSFLKAGEMKDKLRYMLFFFLLVFFLQYKTTVENNFS